MVPINIVLVGNKRSGISSTFNTILQNMEFDEIDLANIGTTIVELKRCVFEGNIKVQVFDTPGFGISPCQSEVTVRQEMNRLMKAVKEIHVFIFVYNYPKTFTQEEKNTVQTFKGIFGNNCLRDHGIIVVTHGDNCESDASVAGTDKQRMFEDWCRNAGKDFNELISEVGGKVLLVTNKGDFLETSPRLKSSQELREMILQVSANGSKFSKKDYEKINKKCVIQ